MINIKVNDITDIKQVNQLDGLGIDFAGFSFDKQSPAYIEGKIKPKDLKKADVDIKRVGCFSDPEMIDVLDAIDNYGLDVVELNGNESTEMCEDLGSEVEVIKAFEIKTDTDIDKLVASYDAVCDYYLFDIDPSLDLAVFKKSRIEKPFFIRGNFDLADAPKIKSFQHPDFFAVDINRPFDKSAGVKDMIKVLQFRQNLKK